MAELQNFIAKHKIASIKEYIFIGNINSLNTIYKVADLSIDSAEFLNKLSDLKIEDRNFKFNFITKLKVTVVHPATENHIKKYLRNYSYFEESFDNYIQGNQFLGTNWITNVLNTSAINEKVFFEDKNSIIVADSKWNRKSIDFLYLLMIFKDQKLKSIRDVESLELLKNSRKNILDTCKLLGVNKDKICMFFHYKPSYFQLHIHIVNISLSLINLGVESRNIYLDEAIRNLEMDLQYYKKSVFILGLLNKIL